MLQIKQGEAKILTLTVTDENFLDADLSAATLVLGLKLQKNQVGYSLSKQDSDFDKTNAAQGVLNVFLNSTDTGNLAPGVYYVELEATWAATYPPTIIKTLDPLRVEVVRPVITP
jgi:hypothetical protein